MAGNQSSCLPKSLNPKGRRPRSAAHNSDIHSPNLEVELTDFPEADESSTTVPPAEEAVLA